MSFLINADNWIREYTVEVEEARRGGGFFRRIWKSMASPAFCKLFGCFVVPVGLVSLVLELVAGKSVSSLFQLFGGTLLAVLFLWRSLLHRRAFLSAQSGGAHHG